MQVFGVSELSAGKLARQRWAIISQARLICCFCCCEREKRSTHTSDHGHKSWALLIWLAPQRFDPVGTILSLPHNGDDEKNLVVFALGGFFSEQQLNMKKVQFSEPVKTMIFDNFIEMMEMPQTLDHLCCTQYTYIFFSLFLFHFLVHFTAE